MKKQKSVGRRRRLSKRNDTSIEQTQDDFPNSIFVERHRPPVVLLLRMLLIQPLMIEMIKVALQVLVPDVVERYSSIRRKHLVLDLDDGFSGSTSSDSDVDELNIYKYSSDVKDVC